MADRAFQDTAQVERDMAEKSKRLSQDQRRPSVLVLILDTLRARNLSCYGYSVRTTPYLDTFAQDCVLFRRAYTTTTWTVPSHASMLSGLYLSQHRVENIQRDRRFHQAIVPLPTALHHIGYKTAGFSQNPLFTPDHHFDYFGEFYGPEDLHGPRESPVQSEQTVSRPTNLLDQAGRYLRKMSRPRYFFDRIGDWIQTQDESSPFLLIANLLNIHYPWAPPPDILLKRLRLDTRYLLKSDHMTLQPWQFNSGLKQVTPSHRRIWRSMYDAAIAHTDRELHRFFERLRQWPGWQNLIVVITSDHGEMLGDYRDIVGHTLSLHANILHVPLLIRHPDYPAGLQVEGVVQTVDLFSSVLDWAGADPAGEDGAGIPAAQLQRPSYSEAVASPRSRSGFAFAEEDYTDSYDVIAGLLGANPSMQPDKFPRQQLAIHSASCKYIWHDDRPAEFYDLDTDPYEQQSLLARDTSHCELEDLERALEEWRESLEVFPPRLESGPEEADAATMDRLRALGYVA